MKVNKVQSGLARWRDYMGYKLAYVFKLNVSKAFAVA